MSRHIRLDIAPATATHCGNGGQQKRDFCGQLHIWTCRAFKKTLDHDAKTHEFKRLPECLAAEKGASK